MISECCILLIDDDLDLLETLSEALSATVHTVLTASSANDALNLMKVSPVDLVVSDVCMPECNGYELMVKIRKKSPKMPVILFSGIEDGKRELLTELSSPNIFLSKPMKRIELIDAIDLVLTDSMS
jgi:DNA-binding NtrC family response regulator